MQYCPGLKLDVTFKLGSTNAPMLTTCSGQEHCQNVEFKVASLGKPLRFHRISQKCSTSRIKLRTETFSFWYEEMMPF